MKKLLVLLVLLFIIISGIFIWYQNGLRPVNAQDKSQKLFVVIKGEGLRAIANSLKQAGLIRDPIIYFLEIKRLGLDGSIQAGDFRLSSSMDTDEIIKSMMHGTVDIWITIPEGDRAEEIAAIFKDKLPTYSSTWLPYLKAHEGYLFPDTYLFPKDADINTIVSIMTNNFRKKYQLAATSQTNSMSQSDVVILASLVQREGKSNNDMSNVASVLENRINIGMPLQVDATVQYVLGYQPLENSWWKKALTTDDLQIVSAYNTYKNPGLGISGVQITEGMKKVFAKIKKVRLAMPTTPSTKQSGNSPKKLVFLLPVVLLIIIASILWYIFGIKARAIIFINPKIVSASQGITFSSTNGTDVSSDTVGATVSPIQENGNVSTQATGSQDVGDKAKGTVTIYNNDSTSHLISQGTTLTSSNGLKFITNSDVTVASASGDIFSGTKPGIQNVDVTASDIGTDYNLPSNTKFSIGSDNVVAAKNDNAFSGGTKKTVTVVSQKDLDKLTSDLSNNLGDKAKQDGQNGNGGDKVVLPTFLDTKMSNQKFDHKLGDQTSSVSLTANITYSTLIYSKSDLDKVALSIIQSNNSGQDISQNNVTDSIQNPTVSKDGKSINATLSIKAGLLPKIDTAIVSQHLAGKSFNQAMSSLSDIPQLSSVQGILFPNLFFLPKSFPRISSHISVEIKANE